MLKNVFPCLFYFVICCFHSKNNLSSVSCDKSLTRYQLFYQQQCTIFRNHEALDVDAIDVLVIKNLVNITQEVFRVFLISIFLLLLFSFATTFQLHEFTRLALLTNNLTILKTIRYRSHWTATLFCGFFSLGLSHMLQFICRFLVIKKHNEIEGR